MASATLSAAGGGCDAHRGRGGGGMSFSAVLGAVVFGLCAYGRVPLWLLAALAGALGLGLGLLVRAAGHERGLLAMDEYACRSGLRDRPTALKAAVAMSGLVAGLLGGSWPLWLWVTGVMTWCSVVAGGVRVHAYVRLLLVPCNFMLLGLIPIILHLSPTPAGYMHIPLGGVWLVADEASRAEALTVAGRAVCGLSCLYMLSLSTPIGDLAALLRRLRVPFVVIDLMYLMYRFVFILLREIEQMSCAAKARAGHVDMAARRRTAFWCAAALLRLAFAQAAAMYDAMLARGYAGELRFIENTRPASVVERLGLCAHIAALTLLACL